MFSDIAPQIAVELIPLRKGGKGGCKQLCHLRRKTQPPAFPFVNGDFYTYYFMIRINKMNFPIFLHHEDPV